MFNVPHMQTHGSFCFLFLKHNFTMSLEIFSLCFFTIFDPRADWFGAEDDLFSYILIHIIQLIYGNVYWAMQSCCFQQIFVLDTVAHEIYFLLYMATLGNCFEIDEWGPIETDIRTSSLFMIIIITNFAHSLLLRLLTIKQNYLSLQNIHVHFDDV
ncbi:hypothetical protein ACJX0J_012835, partial [Zea mays]